MKKVVRIKESELVTLIDKIITETTKKQKISEGVRKKKIVRIKESKLINLIDKIITETKDNDNMMNKMDIATLKSKEVLTAEEAKAVREADSKWAKEYLFHNAWSDTYLNLAVYSEADKEEFDFRKEMGF